MTNKELWKWINKGSWTKIISTDTDYKYTIIGNSLYIGFQGSISLKDWFYNFMFWKKPYMNMKTLWFAHSGYVKKWKSVELNIFIILENTLDIMDIEKVIITGHSQGAAVATLCTESLYYRYPNLRDKIETILFGSPRVLSFWNSRKLKERFNNVKRIEQFWDIIIRVPFVLLGYKHIGKRERVGNLWYKPTFRFIYNHMHYGDYLK